MNLETFKIIGVVKLILLLLLLLLRQSASLPVDFATVGMLTARKATVARGRCNDFVIDGRGISSNK